MVEETELKAPKSPQNSSIRTVSSSMLEIEDEERQSQRKKGIWKLLTICRSRRSSERSQRTNSFTATHSSITTSEDISTEDKPKRRTLPRLPGFGRKPPSNDDGKDDRTKKRRGSYKDKSPPGLIIRNAAREHSTGDLPAEKGENAHIAQEIASAPTDSKSRPFLSHERRTSSDSNVIPMPPIRGSRRPFVTQERRTSSDTNMLSGMDKDRKSAANPAIQDPIAEGQIYNRPRSMSLKMGGIRTLFERRPSSGGLPSPPRTLPNHLRRHSPPLLVQMHRAKRNSFHIRRNSEPVPLPKPIARNITKEQDVVISREKVESDSLERERQKALFEKRIEAKKQRRASLCSASGSEGELNLVSAARAHSPTSPVRIHVTSPTKFGRARSSSTSALDWDPSGREVVKEWSID